MNSTIQNISKKSNHYYLTIILLILKVYGSAH